MMKKVCMFLVLLGWYAIAGNPIELGVVGVLPDDSLNVRKNPSHKSHIVATLAPFARGFYTTKTLPQNPSSWVSVSLVSAHRRVYGWVKRRYVSRYASYRSMATPRLSLRYPSFMKARRAAEGSIEISYGLQAAYYDGCDMRDEPAVQRYFSFVHLSFALYDTLGEALRKPFGDLYKNGRFDASLHYDAQTGWFQKHIKNDWVEELDFHGKPARRIMIGAEGCGVNYYFYQHSGKVILVTEPYNINPPIDIKTHDRLSGSWALPDRETIMDRIVHSLKIR